jgi:iron(III) transport system permease protein
VDKFQGAFAKAVDLCRDNLLASLGYSFLAATLALPVALVLGHAIARWRHGWFLELLCVLPLAAPAILFGIGNIALWNGNWTYGFYTSGGMVVLLYIGRFLAFPTLVCAGAVASLDPKLEQAAELAGAGPLRRMTRIVAPALMPSLMGGWILMFVLAMRELDAAILVPAANDTVMFRMFNAVHFGRDDFVAALALLILFVTIVPGVLWRLFSGKELEVLP